MGNTTNKECGHYHKDKFNVYWNGNKVKEATASSFQDLGNGYGKDKYDYFYNGKLIQKK